MYENAFQPVAQDLRQALTLLQDVGRLPVPTFQEMSRDLCARPGKGLRPALFLLSVRATGPCRSEHICAAAAIEMVHAASLLHDDIIDGGRVRRHAVSANLRWGEAAALVFGDLLFSTAFRRLCEAGLPELCGPMARVIESLCLGEGLQAALQGAIRRVREEDVLRVAQHKTADFFAEACRMGAMSQGAPAEVTAALREYGVRVGLAYQIIDDIVDVAGREEQEGKTLRSDLLLGRPTLPLALFLRLAPERAQQLPIPAPDAGAAAELARAMAGCGAIRAAASRALDELDLAQEALLLAAEVSESSLNGLQGRFEEVAETMAEEAKRMAIAD